MKVKNGNTLAKAWIIDPNPTTERPDWVIEAMKKAVLAELMKEENRVLWVSGLINTLIMPRLSSIFLINYKDLNHFGYAAISFQSLHILATPYCTVKSFPINLKS